MPQRRNRAHHPLMEVIGQDAAQRKAQGQRGYLVNTALDYGVSVWLVNKALRLLGVASDRKHPPVVAPRRPACKLSEEEQRAITWCPYCGHIHIYRHCEWCAGWSNAINKKYADRKQAKKVKRRELLRKKQWLAKRARDIARHHFFGNSPPTKDG